MPKPSQKSLMLAGKLYFANDPELDGERRAAQRLLAEYNGLGSDDPAARTALLRRLFGAVGDGADIQPRFHCDYGYTIRLGRNCFINYNCVFLDCAPIEIGDDLQMAPAVQLYTAYHPLDRATRVAGLEFGKADPHRQRRVDRRRRDRAAGGDDRRRLRRRRRKCRHPRSARRRSCGRQPGAYHP